MIEEGRVRPFDSAWASPIVLVPKKDGTIRFFFFFRQLNTITWRDVFPIPCIDDALDTLGAACWFTTLDLRSGYWQVPMSHEDCARAAFITRDGLFEFTRMVMGLVNSPATFQRFMQHVLGPMMWKTAIVYIDDVVVFSPNWELHLEHIKEVLQRIQNTNLKLAGNKGAYGVQNFLYL